MSDFIKQKADEDFTKARNKALLYEIQNFLKPEKRRMLSLQDVKEILKPKGEVYIGMQTVPIEKIVGSEGRYQDFDNHFLPKANHLRQRWSRVDEAHLSDIQLPPIVLYELGGLYFVRDGNHRVSVARMQGVSFIDAEVISLQSEIMLPANVTPENLCREVIKYEKRLFYAETNFGDITDDWNLDFTSPGSYDIIYDHIQGHKYFISRNSGTDTDFPAAVLSWYTNVYRPVLDVVSSARLIKRFPGRTAGDLYIWIIRKWDELKQKYGVEYPLTEVPKELENDRGKQGFLGKLKNLFKRKRFS